MSSPQILDSDPQIPAPEQLAVAAVIEPTAPAQNPESGILNPGESQPESPTGESSDPVILNPPTGGEGSDAARHPEQSSIRPQANQDVEGSHPLEPDLSAPEAPQDDTAVVAPAPMEPSPAVEAPTNNEPQLPDSSPDIAALTSLPPTATDEPAPAPVVAPTLPEPQPAPYLAPAPTPSPEPTPSEEPQPLGAAPDQN